MVAVHLAPRPLLPERMRMHNAKQLSCCASAWEKLKASGLNDRTMSCPLGLDRKRKLPFMNWIYPPRLLAAAVGLTIAAGALSVHLSAAEMTTAIGITEPILDATLGTP